MKDLVDSCGECNNDSSKDVASGYCFGIFVFRSPARMDGRVRRFR